MIPDLTPAAEELMPYVDYVYGSLADLAVELQQGLPSTVRSLSVLLPPVLPV